MNVVSKSEDVWLVSGTQEEFELLYSYCILTGQEIDGIYSKDGIYGYGFWWRDLDRGNSLNWFKTFPLYEENELGSNEIEIYSKFIETFNI